MNKFVNGKKVTMTTKEVNDFMAEKAQMPPPSSEPTVAELQAEVTELKAMIAKLTEV